MQRLIGSSVMHKTYGLWIITTDITSSMVLRRGVDNKWLFMFVADSTRGHVQ